MKYAFPVLFFLFFIIQVRAQETPRIDSLKKALTFEQSDTAKANTCNSLAQEYRYIDVNLNREYALRAIRYSRPNNFLRGMGTGYNLLAQSYENQGMFAEAIVYYDSSMTIMRAMNSKGDEARILLNISNVYQKTADYGTSAEYCIQSLKLQEERNDTFGIAVCRLTLGNIQYGQGRMKEALGHYAGALEMNRLSEKNPNFEASCVANIGAILDEQGLYDSALVFFRKSESIFRALHADAKTASAMNNIGNCHYHLEHYDSALHYLHIGRRMNEDLQRPDGLCSSLNSLGNVHSDINHPDSAFFYYRSAMKLALQHNIKEDLLSSYKNLSDSFEKSGEYDSSLFYLKKYMALNDIVHGEDEQLKLEQAKQNYNISKKEQEAKLLQAESVLQQEALRSKISILAGGVAVLILLSLLLFTRYRAKNQIAEVLENKNREITTQKDEITDSINYARRIQDSILAPLQTVKQVLPGSFILYLPKDVVSGDFYWVEEENGHRIFAAVDCTGHGVPGALMSVVGFNLLNRAVKEMHLTKPSDILRELDYGVNKLLRQSESENTVKDGMDLSLCSYNPQNRVLQYAGVFNPLYIVRNGEIIQVQADKSPIGVNVNGVVDSFTNHEISMLPGDMVYLFSDGYADQFGGPKGKKFKYKQLRELFMQISSRPVDEQQVAMKNAFHNWKGDLEQVDDVLVIGMRIGLDDRR
ncbi:MAG TPA: tetratricopeptide repeat protein [Bacteroidia bacterium]|nr:tetratricopeptide repeat protein [Bacteroidia bacterium]